MKIHVSGPESSTGPFSGPSPAIWGTPFPSMVDLLQDPGLGFLMHEDWRNFCPPATNTTSSVGGWRCFLSDGGAITSAGIANLTAISATSNDDNEAVVLAKTIAGIRITKNSGRKVAFEARMRSDTITDTKNGWFVGLAEPVEPTATSHIADAGTLADINFIGFHRLEGDGDKVDIVYKADGQTQQSFTDALTLVADTWYKMGFLFDGKETLRFYLNGAVYATADLGATSLDAATFPDDINLAPALVLHKAATGTAEGSNLCNWVRFGFTNNSSDGFA